MLEIIIGIVFTFLLLSLLATTINELLASWRGWRGYFLEEGLQKLLEYKENPETFENFVNNPFYQQLTKHKAFMRVSQAPSYLVNTTFSSILIAVLKGQRNGNLSFEEIIHALPADNKLRLTLTSLKSEGEDVLDSLKELLAKVQNNDDVLTKLDEFIAKLPDDSKSKKALIELKDKGENVVEDINTLSNVLAVQNVGQVLNALPNDSKLRQILGQIKTEGVETIDDYKKNIEIWFDTIMDRTGGWYKRHVQIVTLILGFGIAAFLNADTFNMYRHLASNAGDRQAVVQLATDFVNNNPELPKSVAATDSTATPNQILGEIQTLLEEDLGTVKNPLGIGWSAVSETLPDDDWKDWLYRILGWFVTALAISLGAPFWFDILNKFVQIRGSGTDANSSTTNVVVNTKSEEGEEA